MRSYYCYVRTLDNEFLSCSLATDSTSDLCLLAYKRFRELGQPLPEAQFIRTMRFVSDPRNINEPDETLARLKSEYGHASYSYAVASEYEHGVTVTH